MDEIFARLNGSLAPVPQDLATQDARTDLLRRLNEGDTLYKLVQAGEFSYHAVNKLKAVDPEFCQLFDAARENGWHMLAERALHIAETEHNPHRARVIIDTIKWLLSKRSRKTYGEKLELEIEHKFSLGDALIAARSRVAALRPPSDRADVIDAVIIGETYNNAPDLESGASSEDASVDVWT